MSIFVEPYSLQTGAPVSVQENHEKVTQRRHNILEQHYIAEKRQKEFDAFTSESKDFLLTEALTYVLSKCLPNNIDGALMASGRAVAESFVKEEGSYPLISRFKTKTLFLSELASIIEETHKKVIHGCQERRKEQDGPFKISNSEIKAFHDRLENMDTDTVTKQIIARVTKAEEEFVKANIKDKETLEQLSTATEEKLNGIKNKDQDTENAIKQEAVNRYRQQVDSITNRRKGILESIVTRMATSIVKEESVLEQFKLESGKLNMQKIIDTSEVMYTFLEMVNTLQIKDVDSAYLQEVLTSVQ